MVICAVSASICASATRLAKSSLVNGSADEPSLLSQASLSPESPEPPQAVRAKPRARISAIQARLSGVRVILPPRVSNLLMSPRQARSAGAVTGALLGSTGTPGPIVDEIVTFLMYRPLALAGFKR